VHDPFSKTKRALTQSLENNVCPEDKNDPSKMPSEQLDESERENIIAGILDKS